METFIDPENDEGNKEYKLKLSNTDVVKLEHITSQMRYRLEEGQGEAFYTIGVNDDGRVVGLTDEEYKITYNILSKVATKNNYSLKLLSEQTVDKNRKTYEFLVREKNNNRYIDIRVAVAGNVDSGKCEMKGTLIKMYSGDIKKIEDIRVNDLLLGDDGTPRKVLTTTKGYGQLYKIQLSDTSLCVNVNHILCLKCDFKYQLYYNKKRNWYVVKYLISENKLPKLNMQMFYDFEEATIFFKNLQNNENIINCNDIIELNFAEYINLDNEEQDILKLYRYGDEKGLYPIKNISVQPQQDYFGFELDGNGRYVHDDGIITHNSSLLGVLLTGQKDNGRGSARLNVFNFQHEVKSGRTSSVAQHILGFNEGKEPIYYLDNLGHRKSWPEIVQQSSKIVTFFDLCGHEKYLRTTILGLTSQFPDLALILVGANMGLSKMTKEHIFLCLSLHIPFAIIVTKIDICKDRESVYNETVKEIKKLISAPGIRRIPYDIKTEDDIILSAKNIHNLTTVPIFYVSNVTGQGIQHLYNFFNIYSKKPKVLETNNKVELHIDEIFHVTGVGTVLGGQLIQGKIKVGDKLLVGPRHNAYHTIQVKSIHCKKVSVEEVDSGCYVCLGIKKPDSLLIQRGQIILSPLDRPVQVREFEAEILVLKSHSTTIKVGYEPVVHSCSVRQIAKIIEIKNKKCARGQSNSENFLRTGDRAIVRFRFCYKPEFLRAGFRLLLAEGRVKIIGKIIGVNEETVKIE
jgi:GTPase